MEPVSYTHLKDDGLSTKNYHSVHADLLCNLLGYRYSGQEQTRWVLAPFVGVGLIHNSSNKTSPFAFSYGIQGDVYKRQTLYRQMVYWINAHRTWIEVADDNLYNCLLYTSYIPL